MDTKEERISSLRGRKVCSKMVPLPVWCRFLQNVQEFNGNWIIGTTSNYTKVEETIDEYCRSLPCDFIKSYHLSNIKPNCFKGEKRNRILWQMKDIPFCGVPFSVLFHDVHKCSFSMFYNSKKSRKLPFYNTSCSEEEEDSEDVSLSDGNTEPIKVCPAQIIVKKIIRYSKFSLSLDASKQEKLSALKALKVMSEREPLTDVEEVFWIRLPLPSMHNHSFHCKLRLIRGCLRSKIRELIQSGVTCPERLKSLLTRHVRETYENCINPPFPDDEAYYPSLSTIKNLVYNYMKRKTPMNIIKLRGGEKRKRKDKPIQRDLTQVSVDKNLNTLQDVVQAFCSDSFEGVADAHSDGASTYEAEVSILKREVKERLDFLSEVAQSSNDKRKLTEMLDFLNSFPADSEQRSGTECIKLGSSEVIQDGVYSYADTAESCVQSQIIISSHMNNQLDFPTNSLVKL